MSFGCGYAALRLCGEIGLSIPHTKQKGRNSNEGITAFALLSASLRWNYPTGSEGLPALRKDSQPNELP